MRKILASAMIFTFAAHASLALADDLPAPISPFDALSEPAPSVGTPMQKSDLQAPTTMPMNADLDKAAQDLKAAATPSPSPAPLPAPIATTTPIPSIPIISTPIPTATAPTVQAPAPAPEAPLAAPAIPANSVTPAAPAAPVQAPIPAPAPLPAPTPLPVPEAFPSVENRMREEQEQEQSEIADADKSTGELFDEYQAKRKMEDDKEKLARRKEMVRHEASRNHFEIDYVPNGFANFNFGGITPSGLSPTPLSETSSGISIEWIYFLLTHGPGRFGFGPAAAMYRAQPNVNLHGTAPDFTTIGLKATYEFQFLFNQLLVPFIVGGIDYVNLGPYTNNQAASAFNAPNIPNGGPFINGTAVSGGSAYTPYFGVGLAINLNPLEWKAASDSLISTGIRKYYLAFTYQDRTNANPNYAGRSLFIGIRFEY